MTERDDDASDHLADLTTSFLRATAELDTAALHVVIEDALRHHDVDTVIVDLLVPLMHRVGDLWEQGELSVLAENAASAAVRSAARRISPWAISRMRFFIRALRFCQPPPPSRSRIASESSEP